MGQLEFSSSLKKHYEFRRLYSKGKYAATPYLVVYFRKNGRGRNQVGITVSNKIGKAVVRNRIRRRLREIYRLNEHKFARGVDIVIVARTKSRYAQYGELEHALIKACGSLNLIAGQDGRQ